MSSELSSPRHDTALELDNHGNSADEEHLLDFATTFTYTVTRGVLTIVNANDPATTDLCDSQPRIRRQR